jgi:hypothetical protein
MTGVSLGRYDVNLERTVARGRHGSGRAKGTLRLAAGVASLLAAVFAAAPAALAAPRSASTDHTHPPAAEPLPSGPDQYVADHPVRGSFALAAHGATPPIVVSKADYPGVVRVVSDLRDDIHRVTGITPTVRTDTVGSAKHVVLVGTIGRSPLIDDLVKNHRLDVSGIAGKWETSLQQVVRNPMPGVADALVLAGSDERGTIYAAYDLSKRIGVSPWYWWDDVVPAHHDDLYVLPGRHTQGTPVVKYRGFFINDENPNLGTWGPETFGPGLAPGYPGGFNHKLYAKVFEAALRLRANYIWPAVWGRAFWADDPQNQATANAYGILMGTSHEAPMMCAIDEWNRVAVPAERDRNGTIVKPGHDPYGGTGEWSFRYNSAALVKFWTQCAQRMVDQHNQGVVTMGMRGPGDIALADNTGIDLMRKIISTQRDILARVTGKDVRTIPQVWTLYKEVLRYWNEGLRPPDDVTVVFTDDNWGNIVQLPDKKLPPRAGGYGLYYHFDYVGVGRNYKWVDTASLENTWDQLHQAYAYGDSRLWMANVGDFKTNEEPTQFFLDYAWNPNAIGKDDIRQWERRYAEENFGRAHAAQIGDVLDEYGHLQQLRKPELLNRRITVDPSKNLATDPTAVVYDDQATPFSINDYRELDRVTGWWQRLAARADAIRRRLPAGKQDAYYELVYYEVKATANLYALRRAEFTNILYAKQRRALTNDLADRAEAYFRVDQALMDYFNTKVAAGKWHDFMLQPHIDYGDVARYGPNAPWQQPELNNVAIPDVLFPAVRRIALPATADLGVAIDGSDRTWPDSKTVPVLPRFSPYQTQPTQYIDVFNRGSVPFTYHVRAASPWVKVSARSGRVEKQVRVEVRIDWRRAPAGTTTVPITVTGAGRTIVVRAVVDNRRIAHVAPGSFVEANGYVSTNAADYTRAVNTQGVRWTTIPNLGRTDAGVEPFPVTADNKRPGGTSPRLEYTINTFSAGDAKVDVYLAPRADVLAQGGLRYAVSIDGEAPRVVNIQQATGANAATMNRQWERTTSDNVNLTSTVHHLARPGAHTVRIWMVDPIVVVEKVVVDLGGERPNYLGPPESFRRPAARHHHSAGS